MSKLLSSRTADPTRPALLFTPTLGALLGKAAPVPHDDRMADRGLYMRAVRVALRRPGGADELDGTPKG